MSVLALFFAAAFLVLPVVSLLLALNALSRLKTRMPGSLGGQIDDLRSSVQALEAQVRRLTARLGTLEPGGAPASEAPAAAKEEAAPEAPVEAPVLPQPWVMNPRVLRLNANPNAEIEEDLPCFERDLQHMVTKERG